MLTRTNIAILLFAVLAYLPYNYYGASVARFVTVVGLFREKSNTVISDPAHLVFIDDTVQCEDIHYHEASHRIFLACEDTYEGRFGWFPPVANFREPALADKSTGSIHVIDPETKKSRRLRFANFNGPFVTHGIDVISDPDATEAAVYIFAVNHISSPCEDATTQKCTRKADSRVEIFHHVIGSDIATHLRSVQHPLISTPNDILAGDPRSFYVTNDHHYKDGMLRHLETVFWRAKWSTTVFVEVDSLAPTSPQAGVTARVALGSIYNQNGLGRGRTGEILIGCAGNGVLEIGHASSPSDPTIKVGASIKFDSTIDNPSYFFDPYANSTFNASGYLIAGLSEAAHIGETALDPNGADGSMVWYVPLHSGGQSKSLDSGSMSPRLLFQDDGSRLRTATTAVMVAVDPELEQGRRWAWLFLTGFLSKSALAFKVNLEEFV